MNDARDRVELTDPGDTKPQVILCGDGQWNTRRQR